MVMVMALGCTLYLVPYDVIQRDDADGRTTNYVL